MEKIEKRSKEKPGHKLNTTSLLERKAGDYSAWWSVVIISGGLALWEVASRCELISPLFFPPPSLIMGTIQETAVSGDLLINTRKTLYRMFSGLFIGGLFGLVSGLALGWNPRLKAVFNPLIAAAHPIPKIAIFPLIMVIFGIGDVSKIAVVAVTAFFPMLINSIAGVEQINPVHFEAAANFNASPWMIFRKVLLPGSLPMIMAGFRLAINMSLVLTIAAELVSSNDGLGAIIWLSWEIFRIRELYAGIAVIAVLGIFFNFAIEIISDRLAPWRRGA